MSCICINTNNTIKIIKTIETMATKQSIDFFYEKFNEGHSKIDPQFRASTFEYEMETINKVDGMNVRVIIQSSVFKRNEVLSASQRRNGRKPCVLINHGMNYRIEWKYYDHLLYNWSISCKVKSHTGIRIALSKLLNHIHKNLPSMKINKYTGKIDSVEVCEGFGEHYLTDDTCCVCLDRTMTKTTCNHSVCIECCSNMRTRSPNKDLVCPLCREKFIIQDENCESDYESEDESDVDEDDDEETDDDEFNNENEDESESENIMDTDDIISPN